nr:hypothetical protein [Tanacetum cinerariifolium]
MGQFGSRNRGVWMLKWDLNGCVWWLKGRLKCVGLDAETKAGIALCTKCKATVSQAMYNEVVSSISVHTEERKRTHPHSLRRPPAHEAESSKRIRCPTTTSTSTSVGHIKRCQTTVAHVNAEACISGHTPVAVKERLDVVNNILDADAFCIRTVRKNRKTTLHTVVRYGKTTMLKLLIKRDSEIVTIKDKKGSDRTSYGCERADYQSDGRFIGSNHSTLNELDKKGSTTIHMATRKCRSHAYIYGTIMHQEGGVCSCECGILAWWIEKKVMYDLEFDAHAFTHFRDERKRRRSQVMYDLEFDAHAFTHFRDERKRRRSQVTEHAMDERIGRTVTRVVVIIICRNFYVILEMNFLIEK